MGAFVLSSVCWEYCEDEPTVGDALQFALPFGLVTLAFLTAGAWLYTTAFMAGLAASSE
jgi:hypothetical protein